jgi:hypothetical protein
MRRREGGGGKKKRRVRDKGREEREGRDKGRWCPRIVGEGKRRGSLRRRGARRGRGESGKKKQPRGQDPCTYRCCPWVSGNNPAAWTAKEDMKPTFVTSV